MNLEVRKPVKPTFLTTEGRQETTFYETGKIPVISYITEDVGDKQRSNDEVSSERRSEEGEKVQEKEGIHDQRMDETDYDFDTLSPTPDNSDRNRTLCQMIYKKACSGLGITPSTYFTSHLTDVSLSMPYHGIGAKGAKAVAIALVQNRTITSLDLSNNDIRPEGLGCILEMLQVNKNITELNLSGNCLSSLGAKMVCQALKFNKVIVDLDICDNGFRENDAVYLAEILYRNRTLRKLSVKHSCFREKGGILISQGLEENTTLTDLDLSWNHLRQTGAVAICSSLVNNYTLKSLNLSWNGFGMEGCHEIGKSLMYNRTLTELDLSSNRVSFDAFRQLLRGINNNKALKVLRIGMNPLTTDGAFAILRSVAVSDSALQYIDMTDVSVDSDFLALLKEIQKTKDIQVKYGNTLRHDEIRKGDVVRVLDTDDPVTVLFEYMKAKNLRLIDLLHNLDRDHSDTVSREEFQQGLTNIDLPLSSRSLDILMRKLDLNKDGHVDYEELSIRHKEYMRRVTKLRLQADQGPSHYKGYDKLQQLREAVRLKISLSVLKGT